MTQLNSKSSLEKGRVEVFLSHRSRPLEKISVRVAASNRLWRMKHAG
jgi:hypothetical protein